MGLSINNFTFLFLVCKDLMQLGHLLSDILGAHRCFRFWNISIPLRCFEDGTPSEHDRPCIYVECDVARQCLACLHFVCSVAVRSAAGSLLVVSKGLGFGILD